MSTKSYKCPNCGGSIIWNEESKKMQCRSCNTVFSTEEIGSLTEKNFGFNWKDHIDKSKKIKTELSYTCKSCGAEITSDGTIAATKCPYCDSPIIIDETIKGVNTPNYVIPFQITKEKSIDLLKEFYKGKILLPKFFKNDNKLQKIQGVYVPFWLYDSYVEGEAKFIGTRTMTWREGDYDVIETSYYDIYRNGSADFSKVPADASTKADDSIMDSIEPFDYSQLMNFKDAYLSGYLANKYDVGVDENTSRIESRIENTLENKLNSSVIGYETVHCNYMDIDCSQGNVYYALFPVWFLTTVYNGEIITFAVNGQTGKIAGKLPISNKKLFGIITVVFLIIIIIAQFFIF